MCAATLGIPGRHKLLQCAGVWPTPSKPCSTLFSTLKGKGGKTKRQAPQLPLPSQPSLPLPQPPRLPQLPAIGTAAAPNPAAGTTAGPEHQPMPVSVALIQKKKYAKKSVHPMRDDNEPGPSQEQDEAEPEIITWSLSLSELRDMRKDFSRHPAEHSVTWLLQCWDNGASRLELKGREAKQLGSLARQGSIDKVFGKRAQVPSL